MKRVSLDLLTLSLNILSLMNFFIVNESAMLEFGVKLAKACIPNMMVIYLKGNLGAGKTTLVRGFLRGCGYAGTVKSPTYTLVEPYDFKEFKVFHFDLYRLNDPQELKYIGIEEYFAPNSICLIEWPERGEPILPEPDLICEIIIKNESRELQLLALNQTGKNILL